MCHKSSRVQPLMFISFFFFFAREIHLAARTPYIPVHGGERENRNFEKTTRLEAPISSLHLNLKTEEHKNNRAVQCDPTTYMKYATATRDAAAARTRNGSNRKRSRTKLLQFSGMSVERAASESALKGKKYGGLNTSKTDS